MGEDRADGPDGPEDGAKSGARESPDKQETGETAPEATAVDAVRSQGGGATHAERRARLAEERLTEVLSAYRQVKSENEGFRERVTKNVERRYDQRRERLLLKFIDILDNLDRALEAAEQSYAGGPLIEGLILVRTQLLQTLQEEGLERIPVLGLPYDPNFSEAVGTATVADSEHHHVVVKELLRGYRLKGRIARASRVVVGEYKGPGAVVEAPGGALIGADEVTPAEAAPEPSLEEIVDKAESKDAPPASPYADDLADEVERALKPEKPEEPDS